MSKCPLYVKLRVKEPQNLKILWFFRFHFVGDVIVGRQLIIDGCRALKSVKQANIDTSSFW